MIRGLGIVLFALLCIKIAGAVPECYEPDTRVVSRWKNGNYYKGVIESLTNVVNVLFDNGNRRSYNLHNKYDVVEDRTPEQNEIKWGDPVVVNRPHSFAFQLAHIREIVGGRYMVWYDDGSYIYQTKNDIRVFNKSLVCNQPAYLGCYRDQVPRYLTVFIPTRPATIGACVDMCNAQSYSIAALRNSDLCFCGNSYNKGYQTSDKKCDMPCYDNPYDKCGGVDAFSQYWTGIVGDRPSFRPSGLQAYTKFHMDPYGFQRTYQSAIAKESIPRFGQLPWRYINKARKEANKPSSLANSSPWRWNALTSSWVRADGKQFKWSHLPVLGYKKTYRTWSTSPRPLISRNGWDWNGRAWVSGAKTSTTFPKSNSDPLPKHTNPLSPSTYHRAASSTQTNYHKGYQQKAVQPRISGLGRYPSWTAPKSTSTNRVKSYSNQGFGISKAFTPSLVLQKLADRMSTVKWSQLSNFNQAFRLSSPIPSTFRYLGCFADDYQRDLPFQYSMPASSLTVRSCVLKCRDNSFSVAGLQGSTQCFCGNTYSRYGRVREDECGMGCRGSRNNVCGGVLRNSIYFTGIGSAWPTRKADVHNKLKNNTSPLSSAHAQNTTNDIPARKVTSIFYTKFGTTSNLSKDKSIKTVHGSSKFDFEKKVEKAEKPQMKKKKKKILRNKITEAPEHLPEKDTSGIEDYQVESIKVKVNFSELKKALQTLSPEIVRRVQQDLSRMDHKKSKDLTNHTTKKVSVDVDLDKTKRVGNEDYDEKDLDRIRNEVHNKALDRLTNNNIKEILRIMKIPKAQLNIGNGGKNFEDVLNSVRVAKKKGMGRDKMVHTVNGVPVAKKKGLSRNRMVNTVNGEKIAHEEIESYSRISLDFPLRPTEGAVKYLGKKRVSVNMNKRKGKGKRKVEVKITKKYNDKTKSSGKIKNVSKENSKNIPLVKTKVTTRKASNSKPANVDSPKTNTKAMDVRKLGTKNHTTKRKKSSLKINVKKPLESSKAAANNLKSLKTKAKSFGDKVSARKLRKHSTKADKIDTSIKAKTKTNHVLETKKENFGPKFATLKEHPSLGHQSSSKNEKEAKSSTSDSANILSSNQSSSTMKEKVVSAAVHKVVDKSLGKQGDKSSPEEKVHTTESGNEKVKKSQSDNGVIHLGAAAVRNKSQQKQDERSTQNPSSGQTESVKFDSEKPSDDNGVIYLGAAAKQLHESKKSEGRKNVKSLPDSKEKVKDPKLDNQVGNEEMSSGDSEKKAILSDSKEEAKDPTLDNQVGNEEMSSGGSETKASTITSKANVGSDKVEQEKTNATAKNKTTNDTQKVSKATKKQDSGDSTKEQNKSEQGRKSPTEKATKETEAKISDNASVGLKTAKVNVIQTSDSATDSLPVETKNDVMTSSVPSSNTNTNGIQSDETKTPSQQERKLLTFLKQNTEDVKKTRNTSLVKDLGNNAGSYGKSNNTGGKSEDDRTLDSSGLSEADRVTESKIINKLNNLLNSGSGDDNFEDVIKELERNKINGISSTEITISKEGSSDKNLNKGTETQRSRHNSSSSYLEDIMDIKPGKGLDKNKGGKSIGEDQYGNIRGKTSAPYVEKSPNKVMRLDDALELGSGMENPIGSGMENPIGSGMENPIGSGMENPIGSGEFIKTKYTYFGGGENKDKRPLIRTDDLKRLKKTKKKHLFENSGEESKPSVQKESDDSAKGRARMKPKGTQQRLFAKSSIPISPIYKMILIPKSTLDKNTKSTGKIKSSKHVLGKTLSSKEVRKLNNRKKTTQKHNDNNIKKKTQSVLQKASRHQNQNRQKRKSTTLKKATSLDNGGKYESNVKGVRVVKNGVSFTVSKKPSQNSKIAKKKFQMVENSSRKTSNIKHNSNKQLKVHYISERRKLTEKKHSKSSLKKEINKMNDNKDDILDDAEHNIKDNGSRNQLIWRGNRLHKHNMNLEE